jgi:hypothetical protein
MQAHLASNVRNNELCQDLPPCDVSQDVIRNAMTVVGGVSFGKVAPKGKLDKSEESEIKRMWRVRVWLVEYYMALEKERKGLAVIICMDESYIHAGHSADYSLLPTDDDGNALSDMNRAAGSGERICFIGGITQYGPLVTHDCNGDVIRDHNFIRNTANTFEPVLKNGTFVELNNLGQRRNIYVRQGVRPGLNSMTKLQLQREAEEFDIPLTYMSVDKKGNRVEKNVIMRDLKKKLTISRLLETASRLNIVAEGRPYDEIARDVQRALKLEADNASGKAASAKQVVDVNWNEYWKQLEDMALTCFKFMIANQAKGDYHDNFDTQAFFKWMVAFELVYPVWCKRKKRKECSALTSMTSGIMKQRDRPGKPSCF